MTCAGIKFARSVAYQLEIVVRVVLQTIRCAMTCVHDTLLIGPPILNQELEGARKNRNMSQS